MKIRVFAVLFTFAASVLINRAVTTSSEKLSTGRGSASDRPGTNDIATVDLGTGTRRVVFDNGLTLICREDRSAPVASLQAWCRSGSVHEGDWLGAGLSHILEHMLFKGTSNHGVASIAQTVQQEGGSMNAYTSYDRTVYYIDVPSSGWKTCLDVLADMTFNSTLPVEEYTKEQEVIRREFAMGFDDPGRMSWYRLFETAYTVSPYQHPVIGRFEVYNQLTREDVLAYYKARYAPNNLTFVVVGDVQFDEVKATLEKATAHLKRRPLPPVFIPDEPRQLSRRERHEEFNTELSYVNFGFHVPEITHPDYYPLDVLAVILGQGRSSRLHDRILEKRKLVSSISAFNYMHAHPGQFIITTVCRPEQRTDAIDAILAELQTLQTNLVEPREIEKARKQILSSYLDGLQTMSGQARELGSSWFYTGDLAFSEEYLRRLRAVSAEDVQRVANTYFLDKNLTIVSLNPKGSLNGATTLAAADSAATNDIEVITLSNGARLILHDNPKVPLVSIRACYKSGLLFETPTNNGIARLASSLLIKGTKRRSAEEIAAELEEIGGSISADSGYNSTSLAVDVLSGDLDKGLDILSDVLINPAFPPDQIEHERRLQLDALRLEQDQPVRVCFNLVRSNLFGPNYPYALNPLGTEESLKKLTHDDLLAFHKSLCVASNLVVAVFGQIDKGLARELAERALADIPAAAAPTVPSVNPEPFQDPIRVGAHIDKSQAVVVVSYRGVEISNPDRIPLQVIEEALSSMASRLFIRIREDQGLAYFVGAAQRVGLIPGFFALYAGTRPDAAPHVASELLKEVDTIRAEGLTAAELDRAKAKILGSLKMSRQSNGDFASQTAIDELLGLGARYFREYERQVAAVTSSEVAAAARQYFSATQFVVATVSPKPDSSQPKE